MLILSSLIFYYLITQLYKMSFVDFITHQGRRINREAFIHLVQVSRSDGKLGVSEKEMLHKEGRKFGLTDPEIDQIITMEKEHNYHAPYSLEDKFEHLHNIAEVILADEIVEDNEIIMLRKFAIEAGFDYSKIDGIIEVMIEGIKAGDSDERLFRKFKKALR